MPTFMDVHSGSVGVTAEQFQEAHEADLAIQDEEGRVSSARGSTPSRARPSASSPAEQGGRDPGAPAAGHPADEVYELPVEV